jgi:peptidoglycan pentaglycine glycine transferase (the first glycine)
LYPEIGLEQLFRILSFVPIRLLTSAEDLARYDAWVKQHPQGSLWQSVERMRYIEARGKKAIIYGDVDEKSQIRASALVMIDGTRGGICTWEIPRGPIWTNRDAALKLVDFILGEAKRASALVLYLSPIEELHVHGFSKSSRHVHAEATRMLDLTLSDEQLLAQMHQKGRYNMNVARKNGVTVEQSTDVDAYYALAKKTGDRDGFTIPQKKHLADFITALPGSFLMLARKDDTVIAGLIGVTWNTTGIYYYGASDYEHRSLMAPYLLQWEAMQICKEAGCKTYDLLGVAPVDAKAGHPWAGISSFKEKFGGTVISYPPEQEITLKPMVKRLLEVKRKLIG